MVFAGRYARADNFYVFLVIGENQVAILYNSKEVYHDI
jgi:hypothetical protein